MVLLGNVSGLCQANSVTFIAVIALVLFHGVRKVMTLSTRYVELRYFPATSRIILSLAVSYLHMKAWLEQNAECHFYNTCQKKHKMGDSGDETKQKWVVFIYHNEANFKANDGPSMGWYNPQGSRATRPKGKGKGIMISDFVEKYGGFLALTDDELWRAHQLGQSVFWQLIRINLGMKLN